MVRESGAETAEDEGEGEGVCVGEGKPSGFGRFVDVFWGDVQNNHGLPTGFKQNTFLHLLGSGIGESTMGCTATAR